MSIEPTNETTVTPQGRVTIPAQVRRAAGIEPGDAVVVHVEDGRIVIETRQQLADRTRRDLARNADSGSVADELIADRRADARAEGTM